MSNNALIPEKDITWAMAYSLAQEVFGEKFMSYNAFFQRLDRSGVTRRHVGIGTAMLVVLDRSDVERFIEILRKEVEMKKEKEDFRKGREISR